MINSVVGQNVQWAQFAALQMPPATESSPNGGLAFSNVGTTAADPSVVNPVAASTASPLSSDMSFMLMMFGGGIDLATGSGSATGTGLASGIASTGGSGSATGTGSTVGTGSATQTVGSPDDTSNTQAGSSLASMLADLQSLMAALARAPSAATNTSGAETALIGGNAASGSGMSATSSSPLQNPDNIVSALGMMVATTGSAQPPLPSGTSVGQQNDGNDIANPGSAAAVATWGDGPAGPGGGWQEQFAIAAYELGSAAGPNTASELQGVSV